MRMLVVGAGATGGYFGGRLAQAGREVTFLVRPKRAGQLRANGLQIVSPHGDATVQPQLMTTGTLEGTFDIVLVAVKAFGIAAAIEDFAPAVGSGTMILPVLNGMKHLDILRDRFGGDRVVGGVCKIGATVDDGGRIVHFNETHTISYGEMNGATTDRIRQMHAFMRDAGFDARLSANIENEMWRKWIMLASLGGVTCLMRGNIGEIAGATGGKAVALKILSEVVAVARSQGVSVSDGLAHEVGLVLTAEGSPTASSMYRDLRKGNQIEAEQIIGDLIDRARAPAVATPLLDIVHANLAVYQNRACRGGPINEP